MTDKSESALSAERSTTSEPAQSAERSIKKDRDAELYFLMKLSRAFEERVAALHKQNKIIGGVYSGIGQEAVVVGTCYGLQRQDFIAPLHRDLGCFLVKGVDPRLLMAQLMGKKTGLSKGKDSFLHGGDLEHGVFGATSMLASTLPVAVGAALKFKMKREASVAIAFFGEGAGSRGPFHEALNFAGIHKLPVVFVCENNRYAYSTPQELQIPIDDVADRAAGYGFKGVVCSGNDLHAVLEQAQKAVRRAREGGGSTLIECKTYRYHGHSEHDMATYRTADELIEWESRDPILRWEIYLEKRGRDIDVLRAAIESECREILDEAVRFAEDSPLPEGKEAMEDLYAMPIERK